ncbi:hypothetical protein EBB79_19750 [Parasedimentitalea marina]|uniref:Uncharacterized protein n=1 Tax=Parasedimentitalea marina TaxID=2483033 RepID=A0A3T0N772_9RHOB|nr:hypothetical protein EBB79_19750 [Parasedimentitalea marina]
MSRRSFYASCNRPKQRLSIGIAVDHSSKSLAFDFKQIIPHREPSTLPVSKRAAIPIYWPLNEYATGLDADLLSRSFGFITSKETTGSTSLVATENHDLNHFRSKSYERSET